MLLSALKRRLSLDITNEALLVMPAGLNNRGAQDIQFTVPVGTTIALVVNTELVPGLAGRMRSSYRRTLRNGSRRTIRSDFNQDDIFGHSLAKQFYWPACYLDHEWHTFQSACQFGIRGDIGASLVRAT
jgi:hypothetical protein